MTFQTKLLRWFKRSARALPWRAHYEPYAVWVSEIMLQQTQMDTVLPYYERWMKRFPDIRSLARAAEPEVLKLWEGLGYYSRARNLHAAAKILVRDQDGRFPTDFESIRRLPGVGRYTAGAIASIAFNQTRPIVDGNVLRVLARFYAIRKPVDVPKNRETFWSLQERLIPAGAAREFNQALMELGALVCTPKTPRCESCPLAASCRARAQGTALELPVKSRRPATARVTAAALALRQRGAYLILRRPVGGLMGGLWEFPEWKLAQGPVHEDAVRSCAARLGLRPAHTRPLTVLRRSYTRFVETLHVFEAQASSRKVKTPRGWQAQWVSPDAFREYAFSSAHARIAARLT